jgi:adenylylsulfate kinase
VKWFEGGVPREEKERRLGQRGCVLWFTGLSGSGKSTVAATVEHALAQAGHATALLDGDNVRHGLNCNLGFSAEDRSENIRRIGEVSRLLVQTGLITLAAFISPYQADRQRVRERLPPGDFIEVYMRVPLQVCEQRDAKGLYKKARAGQCTGFTGIDDPYEEPEAPELTLNARDASGQLQSVTAMAATVLQYLEQHHYLQAPEPEHART